jgi:predicted unusual protein kinase regulating ubiquinone biosynthesis (AarF/ABC1/UbiB family)
VPPIELDHRTLPPWTRLFRFLAVGRTVLALFVSYRFGRRDAGGESARHRRNAERILRTVIDMQGLLIKVCQWIATRADLLPDEYVEVLSQLHDRVPPRPWRAIRPHLEKTFGRPVTEVFRRFEHQPIAAASLAQVHEAELWDGRRVAVKVQYPDIAAIVASDVRNLGFFLGLVRRLEGNLDFVPILREVRRYVAEELDFVHEGRNAESIAALYPGRTDVIVPKIVWDLSSRKVLVMEFVEGIKVTEVGALRAAGIDPQAVAERLIHVYSEQILLHGLFHADPHPGNVLVRVGSPPELVLLDFGVVKRLPDKFRRGLAEVLLAMLRGRPAEMFEGLGRLGFRTRDRTYQDMVPLGQAMLRFAGERPESISDSELVARFGTEILKAYRQNPVVRVPEDILLVMRVMGILGGVERQLGARVNLVQALLPFAKQGAAVAG